MGGVQELLPSYVRSLNSVRNAQERVRARPTEERGTDAEQLRGMEGDLRYAMAWLRFGFDPEDRHKAERGSREHRERCYTQTELDRAARQAGRALVSTAELSDLSPGARCQWQRVLLGLSTGERRAVQLVWGEGYQANVAAQIMGVSDVQVRQHLHRARKKFSILAQKKAIC